MINIQRSTVTDEIIVLATEDLPDGTPINYLTTEKGIVKRVKYHPYKEGEVFFKGTSHGMIKLLTELLDEMIEFGIRPKKHLLSNEEKTALENHLSDMRKIVEKKLNVKL
jgi:hypothetical protein